MIEKIDLPLAMFPAEILQRLGYQANQVVMKKIRDILMYAMDEARASAHPQAVIRTAPMVRDSHAFSPEGANFAFEDPDLLSWAQNCTHLSVFAVTLGLHLEQKIQDFSQQGQDTQAEVLRAVQTSALVQAANLLCDRLIMQGIRDGFQLTHCFYLDNLPHIASLRPQIWRFLDLSNQLVLQTESSAFSSESILLGMIGWIPFESLI